MKVKKANFYIPFNPHRIGQMTMLAPILKPPTRRRKRKPLELAPVGFTRAYSPYMIRRYPILLFVSKTPEELWICDSSIISGIL